MLFNLWELLLVGEDRWRRCWRRESKWKEGGDEDLGGGSGSVVELNFSGGLGWRIGLYVGIGYTGLLTKRLPSMPQIEK